MTSPDPSAVIYSSFAAVCGWNFAPSSRGLHVKRVLSQEARLGSTRSSRWQRSDLCVFSRSSV